ncbi:MAG: DMT family transporter [Oxalobacteraceae bacterium]|nr:DMT family transporter [Oxalobacteraceae bacterium]
MRKNQNSSCKQDRVNGVLLIALSATGFGAMPVFTRYAYADGADLYGVLITRFWVAGLALLAVAYMRKLAWPPLPLILRLAALGGFGYVGMSYCYFSALNYMPASLAALLLYVYPTIVTLLAALFLHERITAVKLAALLLCSLGTALTIGPNMHGAAAEISALGIGLALAAAMIYASYITVGTKISQRVDPIMTTLVVCLAAAAVFTLLALIRTAIGVPPQFPQTASGWIGVAGVTIFSTVIAVIAFFAGLKRLGASQSSMLSTLEPVVTIGLAAGLLSESLSDWQLLGGALTLTGVIWLAGSGKDAEVILAQHQKLTDSA